MQKLSNYNFSIYNRAANLYIERFNSDGMYELTSSKPINQFQLTQPLIAGKRFFQYSLHYVELFKNIEKLVTFKYQSDVIVQSGCGDSYVYNLFINVLMFFVDKFSMENLTDSRLKFFFKWAYSLRVCMKAVYRESVNKYAQGKSDRVNFGLNMFSLISDMQDPNEIDSIVLDYVSEEQFKKSKINVDKYNKMYVSMFGKDS